MVQGPVEKGVLRQAMASGMPVPKKFAEAPMVPLGTELYISAFWDLNSCRPGVWGLAPIPWSAMMDYARAYDFDEIQTEDLVYYTRVLDKVYMEQRAKEKPK